MARVVQQRSGPPYLLIVFVFLFVVSASLAVLFYMWYGEVRGQRTELKALNGEVYLDGDPEHAGFQYRPHDGVAKGPDEGKAKYLFHKEGIDPRKDKDLPWVAMEYGLNGKKYSVQYMSDPANPNADAVYSAYRDYGRFGEFFKHTIPAGQTLKLRYRIRISEGSLPNRELLSNQYAAFTTN